MSLDGEAAELRGTASAACLSSLSAGRVKSAGVTDGHTGSSRAALAHDSTSRLFAALQSRAGHALVIGDDPAAAEALFERVDAQLVCQRRVRLPGRRVDADAMIHALGADIRGPHRPRSGEAILSMVATEARAAGLPILVVVTAAEDAGAAALQRLGTLIESVPDARAAVRLVLLGGPLLEDILAHPDAAELSARILTTVRAPARGDGRWVFPLPIPRLDSAWRDTVQWVVAGLIAMLGVFLIVSPWVGRDAGAPIGVQTALPESEEDAPAEATAEGMTEPEDADETVEEHATAEAAPAAVAAPEPAAADEPPVADSAAAPERPPVAEPLPATAPPATEVPRAATGRVRRPVPPIGRSLQVGAFRDAANANALAAKLSELFPDVRVVTVMRGGTPLHCVRLGGFADEYALAARADQLRAAGYASIRAPE